MGCHDQHEGRNVRLNLSDFREIESAIKTNKTNMNTSKTEAIDPICGMTVDTDTALHAERDGKTSYFCSEHCRGKFLSTPADAKPDDKSDGCCCG